MKHYFVLIPIFMTEKVQNDNSEADILCTLFSARVFCTGLPGRGFGELKIKFPNLKCLCVKSGFPECILNLKKRP